MESDGLHPPTTNLPPQLEGIHILLAEDSKPNQITAQQLLESHGASVTLAENGLEAVAAAKKQHFDLMLMAVQMPKLNGYQTTEEIRKEKQFKKLPIIAMTAHHTTADEWERCRAVGMNDHFPTPLTLDDLQQLLVKWIAPTIPEENIQIEIQANLNKLAERLDENSLQTSLDAILNCVPERLASLTHAVTTNDRETIKKQAHKLRGSLNIYGTKGLTILLEQIETGANTENKIESIIQQLNSEFNLALKLVRDMQNRPANPDIESVFDKNIKTDKKLKVYCSLPDTGSTDNSLT